MEHAWPKFLAKECLKSFELDSRAWGLMWMRCDARRYMLEPDSRGFRELSLEDGLPDGAARVEVSCIRTHDPSVVIILFHGCVCLH